MQILGKSLDKKPERKLNVLNLSVSKLKTFEQCKAKFKFSYLDKLPKVERDFQIFGKFNHAALEFFHKEIIAGYSGSDSELMKSSFIKALKEYKGKITKEQKDLTFTIRCNYLKCRSDLKSKNILPTTVAVEKEFNVDIDGKILLNGFIDLIQKDHDGVLHVADYKTSKDDKYLKKDMFQLETYAYVMCLEDPTLEVVRCSYIILKQESRSIVKEFTRKHVLSLEETFLKKAKDILEEKLYRPTPTMLCDTCDYLEHCSEGRAKIEQIKGPSIMRHGEVDW